MEYVVAENDNNVVIVVNGNIIFMYDPAEPFYDIFKEKIAANGWEPFAQLLANDPNTAFTIFCNG